MDKINLGAYRSAHFIGIGGISMSGLAEILKGRGMQITGSDVMDTPITKHLRALGITVTIPQNADNIRDDADLIVYTAAVKKDNPEIVEAERRGLKIIDRAQLLGTLMEEYDCPICISGTHGKTTTTSMISEIMLSAGKDPTITSGGVVKSINSSFRVGSKELLIVEACEYFNSFLKFSPQIGIILNIDADHLDFFGDIKSLENSFAAFAKNIKSGGTLIINADVPSREEIAKDLSCKVITFGNSLNSDWQIKNVLFDSTGLPSFDVFFKNTSLCSVKLKVPGMHNAMNALAAFAAAYECGLSPKEISDGLASFGGTKRRYEYKGTFNGGAIVIDDYAHHPTEVKATLETAKLNTENNIICLFQPHTYTRTINLFDEFAEALAIADEVVAIDIYAAREHNEKGIGSKDLVNKINETHPGKAKYFPSFVETEKYFLNKCIPSDVLITMGAGDVYLVGDHILSTQLSTLPTFHTQNSL